MNETRRACECGSSIALIVGGQLDAGIYDLWCHQHTGLGHRLVPTWSPVAPASPLTRVPLVTVPASRPTPRRRPVPVALRDLVGVKPPSLLARFLNREMV